MSRTVDVVSSRLRSTVWFLALAAVASAGLSAEAQVGGPTRMLGTQNLLATGGAEGVVLADLDANGVLDVISVETDDELVVLLSDCVGGFQEPTIYPNLDGGQSTSSAHGAAADVDQDGAIDVLVTCPATDSLAIYYGVGDGTLLPAVYLPAGASARRISVADWDTDGFPDVAVTNFVDQALTLLMSAGSPGVGSTGGGTTVTVPSIEYLQTIGTGDFDEDGLLDLVVASAFGDAVAVHLATAPGVFAPPTVISDFGAGDLAVDDYDGDGHLDLAAVRPAQTEGVRLFWGAGDGSFAWTEGSELLDDPIYLTGAVRSFELDGQNGADLLVRTNVDKTLHYLRNDGDRTFTIVDQWVAPDELLNGFAVDDLDQDGRLDLVLTASYLVHRVLVDDQFRGTELLVEGEDFGSIGTGDFNGDGILDLALSSENALTLHYGVADPEQYEVGSSVTFPTTGRGGGLEVVDFDGDGDDDVVAVFLDTFGGDDTRLVIFRSGELQPVTETLLVAEGGTLIIEDYDRDGALDIIVGHGPIFWPASAVFSLVLGDGFGGVQSPILYDHTWTYINGDAADLNGDGYMDLVYDRGGEIGIRFGMDGPNGIAWGPESSLWVNSVTLAKIVDINGDGFLDIVGVNFGHQVFTRLGNGTGSFTISYFDVFPYPASTFGETIADVDGDGNLDVVAAVSGGISSALISRGVGNGTFLPAESYRVPVSFSIGQIIAVPAKRGVGQDLIIMGRASSPFTGSDTVQYLGNRGPASDCDSNGVYDGCDLAQGALPCVLFIRADANQDLSVNLADAIRTLDHLFGADPADCLAGLDTNADENVDIADVVSTLGYLFDGAPAPSAPFPECGSDLSGGGLECASSGCD